MPGASGGGGCPFFLGGGVEEPDVGRASARLLKKAQLADEGFVETGEPSAFGIEGHAAFGAHR